MASNSASEVTIRGNVLHRTSMHMMFINGMNHLIEGNLFDDSSGYDAIRIFGSGSDIRGNVFTNISELATNSNHTDIVQTFGDNGYESHDMVFEGNLVINSICQGCMLEQTGVPNIRDWTFRNNIYCRMLYACTVYIPGVRFYNNTFYQCTTNFGHALSFNSSAKGSAFQCEVVNNIFYECGSVPSSTSYGWYYAATNLTDFVADYNFVCGSNFAAKATAPARDAFHFQETHGVNGGDPRFVGPTVANINMMPTRLVVDTALTLGSSTNGFSTDFIGTARPIGPRWDMGAVECNITRPLPPTSLRILGE